MKYLLDVNALVAFGFFEHIFHEQLARWVRSLAARDGEELATCAITELGFVRILAQAPQYGLTVNEAKSLLSRMKTEGGVGFSFITDDQDVSRLPGWVKMPKQITDGHLVQLAKGNGAVLATLDRNIPGAFLIPEEV
ncbi:MAG TPA: PIN domain-containing protein [Candidatus Acidoferrum sp.]